MDYGSLCLYPLNDCGYQLNLATEALTADRRMLIRPQA
jgi:hypothetical protein